MPQINYTALLHSQNDIMLNNFVHYTFVISFHVMRFGRSSRGGNEIYLIFILECIERSHRKGASYTTCHVDEAFGPSHTFERGRRSQRQVNTLQIILRLNTIRKRSRPTFERIDRIKFNGKFATCRKQCQNRIPIKYVSLMQIVENIKR